MNSPQSLINILSERDIRRLGADRCHGTRASLASGFLSFAQFREIRRFAVLNWVFTVATRAFILKEALLGCKPWREGLDIGNALFTTEGSCEIWGMVGTEKVGKQLLWLEWPRCNSSLLTAPPECASSVVLNGKIPRLEDQVVTNSEIALTRAANVVMVGSFFISSTLDLILANMDRAVKSKSVRRLIQRTWIAAVVDRIGMTSQLWFIGVSLRAAKLRQWSAPCLVMVAFLIGLSVAEDFYSIISDMLMLYPGSPYIMKVAFPQQDGTPWGQYKSLLGVRDRLATVPPPAEVEMALLMEGSVCDDNPVTPMTRDGLLISILSDPEFGGVPIPFARRFPFSLRNEISELLPKWRGKPKVKTIGNAERLFAAKRDLAAVPLAMSTAMISLSARSGLDAVAVSASLSGGYGALDQTMSNIRLVQLRRVGTRALPVLVTAVIFASVGITEGTARGTPDGKGQSFYMQVAVVQATSLVATLFRAIVEWITPAPKLY